MKGYIQKKSVIVAVFVMKRVNWHNYEVISYLHTFCYCNTRIGEQIQEFQYHHVVAQWNYLSYIDVFNSDVIGSVGFCVIGTYTAPTK